MVSGPVSEPLSVTTDPAHGGRWTSLRAGGREWLWRRDEPRRPLVAPGDAFADAGGLEECVPTVRGTPDHGDAWSRPWRRDGDEEDVDCPDFRLTRRIRTDIRTEGDTPGSARTTRHPQHALVADYRLTAAPGYRFLWAAHALLDVSPRATLAIRHGTPVRLYPDDGADWHAGAWPQAGGLSLDRLGPDDGTAVGAVVATPEVSVHDGRNTLHLAVEAAGQPVSVALWRNLGGFPAGAPYRSIGVEPMLGRVFDLSAAGEDDAARVPASGEVRWRLTITTTTAEPTP
ncbi:hypothetical protein [Streptomyces sp. NPDC058665]|uniref:hypothetical protein n=1 Tax=Streptomyces sp. NPDC058665 TaxID=3346586 RepID=UPI00365A177C